MHLLATIRGVTPKGMTGAGSVLLSQLAKPGLRAAIYTVALGVLLLLGPMSMAQASENWSAYSKTAEAITGDVTFTPNQITFGNGVSLSLTPFGTIPGFRALGQKVTAQRYRVTAPADPVLLNGNRLCGGRTPIPVTFFIVSRVPPSPPVTPALISLEVFGGRSNTQDCGNYNFEAETAPAAESGTLGNRAAPAWPRADHQNSIMRPGALDDIPHLTEIIWDEMDLPSLMAVRYLPQKTSFAPGWTEWVLQTIFRQDGLMTNEPPSPWPPPFFVANVSRTPRGGYGISPEDMARFQNWCEKRAEALPPIIVQSIPYLAPLNPQKSVQVLPFGIQPGETPEDQRVEGIGFSQMIYLGLARNADDYAVELPADVVARLPRSGLRLETRVRWSDPERREGTLFFATEPLSLRLVAGKQLFWEHRYDAGDAIPGQAPQGRPTTPPPDIKF